MQSSLVTACVKRCLREMLMLGRSICAGLRRAPTLHSPVSECARRHGCCDELAAWQRSEPAAFAMPLLSFNLHGHASLLWNSSAAFAAGRHAKHMRDGMWGLRCEYTICRQHVPLNEHGFHGPSSVLHVLSIPIVCAYAGVDACEDACQRAVCLNMHQVPAWNDACLRKCTSECVRGRGS